MTATPIRDRLEQAEPFVPTVATDRHLPIDPRRDLPLPLPFEWFENVQAQLVGFWLIKKLLPAIGIAVIYGHPGTGKSFLALDWALHIALGWDWRGRKVKAGLVVYVCAEGVSGLRNRVEAFRRHHGVTHAPFILISTPIDMQAPDADVRRLITTIDQATETAGVPVAAIFIDTVSKTFGAGKENSDDMVSYVNNCQMVATRFECLTIPVHHRPKDAESEDPRGHSSLRGNIDTLIIVDIVGDTKRMRVKKQKDGEDGLTETFKLKVVELGEDEDGEAVTSCILVPADVDANDLPLDAQPRRRIPESAKAALRTLDETCEAFGFAPPTDIPATEINLLKVGKVVRFETWRDKCISAAGTSRDNKRDTEKRAFNRAKEKLQDLGIVRVWNDYAWRTHEAGTSRDSWRDTSSAQPGQAGTTGTPLKGCVPPCPARPPVAPADILTARDPFNDEHWPEDDDL
jgi:KaiC/GvpD/RAD55 family RecA-like ATPase